VGLEPEGTRPKGLLLCQGVRPFAEATRRFCCWDVLAGLGFAGGLLKPGGAMKLGALFEACSRLAPGSDI